MPVPHHGLNWGDLCPVTAPNPKIYVVGGRDAVGADVVRTLREFGGKVVRIRATHPSGTPVAVARAIARHRPAAVRERVFLATDARFQEALVASAAAGKTGGAVLLTHGQRLPRSAADYLARHPRAKVVAVGSDAVRASRHLPHVMRVTGANPYAISARFARRVFPRAESAVFTIGGGHYAWANLAGVYAGEKHAPVLLVRRDHVPTSVRRYLSTRSKRPQGSVLIGDEAAVSKTVFDRLTSQLTPRISR